MKFAGFPDNKRWCVEAFLRGAKRRDHEIVHVSLSRSVKTVDCVVSIGWGPQIIRLNERCREAGVLHLAITDGFAQPRGAIRYNDSFHYAIGRNCIGAYSELDHAEVTPDRWGKLGIEIQPWREDGETIIIAHQHFDGAFYNESYPGGGRQEFFTEAIEAAKSTGQPFVFCRHPRGNSWYEQHGDLVERLKKNASACYPTAADALSDDSLRPRCLITHNSNSAVEAILAGIPAFTAENGKTMADRVAMKGIEGLESPRRPDREDVLNWAHWLAYQQWTLAEMREGLPLDYLFKDS